LAQSRKVLSAPVSLPRIARYTFARHWPASLFEGLAVGIVNLTPFVVKRSLGAPAWVVPLVIMLWQVPWILAPGVGTILASAHPQNLWRRLAWLAHAPLLAIAFLPVVATTPGHGEGSVLLFCVPIVWHYLTAVAVVPHRGAMVRTNYPRAVRGRLWGTVQSIGLAGAALTALLAGRLLDADARFVRALYPAAAVLGYLGFVRAGRIRWHSQERRILRPLGEPPGEAMRRAWHEAWRILRKDRDFRVYELGFMLYGFGFLCSVGILHLYAEDALALSYSEWTLAQFLAFPIGQVVGSAFFGRVADRFGMARTAMSAFLILAVFFGSMNLVGSAGGLFAAYLLWGLGMGGVMITWALGPLHFAPDGKGHMYAALHFALVGVRSLFAPALGYAMKSFFDYGAAFGLSVAFFLVAAATVRTLARRGH